MIAMTCAVFGRMQFSQRNFPEFIISKKFKKKQKLGQVRVTNNLKIEKNTPKLSWKSL